MAWASPGSLGDREEFRCRNGLHDHGSDKQDVTHQMDSEYGSYLQEPRENKAAYSSILVPRLVQYKRWACFSRRSRDNLRLCIRDTNIHPYNIGRGDGKGEHTTIILRIYQILLWGVSYLYILFFSEQVISKYERATSYYIIEYVHPDCRPGSPRNEGHNNTYL